MGRYFLELDPDGFYYTAEPGAHFEWGAVKLVEGMRERFAAANPGAPAPADNFYSLPGHPWVMCRPRQTDPQWYKDSRLDNHVLRDGSEWVWSPEVTVKEWEPTKKPDGTTFPKNKWQTITIPEGATSLTAPAWDAISLAAGFLLPENMVVAAVAAAPPAGGDFLHTTPHIQVQSMPGPDDVCVFGFGQYALIFAGGNVTLVKTDYESATDVKRLGSWAYAGPSRQTSPFAAHSFEQFAYSVMVLETPPAHLGLVFGGGNDPQVVEAYKTEPGEIYPVIVNAQSWWVAAPEKTHLSFQVQVVGYEDATSEGFETGTFSPDFDLGASYRPLIEPSLDAKAALHFASSDQLVKVVTTNSYELSSLYSLEQVELSLLDEAGAAWSSDGTHHAGRWRLEMGTSTAGFLTPYFRDVMLKFPVRLTPRLNNPLILDDTQFASFDADVSLLDPGGKRVNVNLWDTGAKLLKDNGFDEREGYPIQIWQDTTGNDVPDTLIVTGWVFDPKITEFKAETTEGDQVWLYQLKAKGLLSRLDSEWTIMPQMVDPAGGGFIEHTYAIQETLLAGGFDITDPAQYAQAVDSQSGTARARLPGTFANRPYTLQLDPKNEYAPSFDESKLDYATRIATRWAGWVLYETLAGQVRYHPNLTFELSLGGIHYYISLLVFNNSADALAASSPRQRYEAGAEQSVRQVVANSVRIFPPEPEEGKEALFDPVIANDPLGWSDSSYWNFVGEPRSKSFCFKEADTQEAAHNMAVVLLLTLGQRGVDWPIAVPLAPWAMVVADACEIGYVAEVQGLGDRLITHMQVELLTSRPGDNSQLKTRMTVTKLPALATAALTGTIPYPGRMNPVV